MGRESRHLRELAGSVEVIVEWLGVTERSGLVGQAVGTGSRASGPSSRRMWKQRRASLRAMVSEARVWLSPRALSAR